MHNDERGWVMQALASFTFSLLVAAWSHAFQVRAAVPEQCLLDAFEVRGQGDMLTIEG